MSASGRWRARKILRACALFIADWLPESDQRISSVDRMLALIEPERNKEPGTRRDPIAFIFWELANGYRRTALRSKKDGHLEKCLLPSTFRSNIDGTMPFKTINDDGSRGFLKSEVRDETLEASLDYCWYPKGDEEACVKLARDVITYCGLLTENDREKLFSL